MADVDDDSLSADDSLEADRGSTAQPVGNNPLPEDNDSPAAPADNPSGATLPDDHQLTDNQSNIDDSEAYEEGVPGAVEAGELPGENFDPGD